MGEDRLLRAASVGDGWRWEEELGEKKYSLGERDLSLVRVFWERAPVAVHTATSNADDLETVQIGVGLDIRICVIQETRDIIILRLGLRLPLGSFRRLP